MRDKCWPISRGRITFRNTKIGKKVVHSTGNNAHQFQGQMRRSRSPGRHNVRPEVHHIFWTERPIRTSYLVSRRRTKTRITDKRRDLKRSMVKVARSRDASDRCWPISRERNDLETSKLVVGRLFTPRAIMRKIFKDRSRSPDRLMLTQ